MTDEPDWVTDLLRDLPDPPMPADVRTRLDAALVQTEVPRRKNRRPMILVGAAAAALVAVVLVVDPFAPATRTGPDLSVAGEPTLAQISQASLSTDTDYRAHDMGQQLKEIVGLRTVHQKGQRQAESDVATAVPPPPRSWAQVTEAAATSTGLAECVWSVPWDDEVLLIVDRGSYQGEPAIIWARQDGPVWEVVVQRPSCDAEDPAIAHQESVPD